MNDKFSREEALETDKFVGVEQPFVYDVEDLMTTVAITGPNYFSQNANGTHSIMLKSAFRVFITVVDGEPRIGFFRDCSGSWPTYTLLGATNLENPEWKVVAYAEAGDASGASELPLFWSKPKQDANAYRFFKIGLAQTE